MTHLWDCFLSAIGRLGKNSRDLSQFRAGTFAVTLVGQYVRSKIIFWSMLITTSVKIEAQSVREKKTLGRLFVDGTFGAAKNLHDRNYAPPPRRHAALSATGTCCNVCSCWSPLTRIVFLDFLHGHDPEDGGNDEVTKVAVVG